MFVDSVLAGVLETNLLNLPLDLCWCVVGLPTVEVAQVAICGVDSIGVVRDAMILRLYASRLPPC